VLIVEFTRVLGHSNGIYFLWMTLSFFSNCAIGIVMLIPGQLGVAATTRKSNHLEIEA
jgi:hypothetical protein